MAEQTSASALPDKPSLEWLRKEARRRLAILRKADPGAKLADAQLEVARQYGFSSWRALKAHVDSLTVDGQLMSAARDGDVTTHATLLDRYTAKLHIATPPYGGTLLHLAARHVDAVDLLLRRGMDVNAREGGDNTYAMHWAAAEGKLDVVRRLADAGGDVIGEGDDHMGGVIGWASCSPGCDDDAHRAVVDFLVSRGARHHIFSAVALNLADEVRHIVATNPAALNQRMSPNESRQTPLHFAVRMTRPQMIELLVELGADPLAVDDSGVPAAMYANTPDIDRPIMERIHQMTLAELTSASRGHRQPRVTSTDLLAALAVDDVDTAARLVASHPALIDKDGAATGVTHVMAKRGDARAIRWLLTHGADPNARWGHWDAALPPIHLAAAQGHADVVRLLLDAGADPTIRDSKHDGDAIGWAEYGARPQAANWREIVEILKTYRGGA